MKYAKVSQIVGPFGILFIKTSKLLGYISLLNFFKQNLKFSHFNANCNQKLF